MPFYYYIVLCLTGYLLGNVSFAKVISRFKHDDITKHGSGNPGSMNMLRTFGFKTGLLTIFLDGLKGAIPALIGFFMFGGYSTGEMAYIGLYVGGISAVIGHCFPIASKFKGGKGVATTLGMFAVAEPYLALGTFVICFLYLIIFDYGAIASFLFITALTLYEGYRFHSNLTISILLLVVYFLIFYMHRKNITRLLIGKENKVNLKDKLKKIGKKKVLVSSDGEQVIVSRKQIRKEKKIQKKEEINREIG